LIPTILGGGEVITDALVGGTPRIAAGVTASVETGAVVFVEITVFVVSCVVMVGIKVNPVIDVVGG
jgi:hypothetical protein